VPSAGSTPNFRPRGGQMGGHSTDRSGGTGDGIRTHVARFGSQGTASITDLRGTASLQTADYPVVPRSAPPLAARARTNLAWPRAAHSPVAPAALPESLGLQSALSRTRRRGLGCLTTAWTRRPLAVAARVRRTHQAAERWPTSEAGSSRPAGRRAGSTRTPA